MATSVSERQTYRSQRLWKSLPACELTAAMKQIKELPRLLGKKTMEVELLKEAVEHGRVKKWIAHAPLLPGDTN